MLFDYVFKLKLVHRTYLTNMLRAIHTQGSNGASYHMSVRVVHTA